MQKRYLFWMGIAVLALAVVFQGVDVQAGTTGKIQGVVRDAATGEPLPGANVLIEGTRRGATTDVNGYYTILLVDPGTYTMAASMIGYDAQRKTDVRVQSDFTSDVNFLIRESSLELGEMVVVAERPPVEPDRTTSKYIVGADDIENIPMVRSASEFIELQAGVSVDGDVSIRAGDSEDTAYYVDGVRIPTQDANTTRVYRDVNRSSIQEMTVVTGGMAAEYGNAQGGVVSFVTREGGQDYHGMVDYQFQPSGQKHWGPDVYDSNVHRGNNQWDTPDWVGEQVTLPDGSIVPAHQRIDYTGQMGHFLEGNLSGPVTETLTFFVSSKWRKEASVFPGPNLTTPFNTNTNLKLSYSASPTLKIRAGGFLDRREGDFRGPDEGGILDMRNNGKNLFMTAEPNPAGGYVDQDWLMWASATHSISPKTFYEVTLSLSNSTRDTSDLPYGGGLTNPETAITDNTVKDLAGYYAAYRQVVDWERFDRTRLGLKADVSSQVNKQNFLKAGLEVTRYSNWYQKYESTGPSARTAIWYSKTYSDTDFFSGKANEGVAPIEAGVYLQDKIEFEGMIVNAGIRADAFWVREMTTDVDAFYGAKSPMWKSMTRNRNVPTVDPTRIGAISPRVGVSHPITSKSLIRFFYGKFTQMPNFRMLYQNEWQSQSANDRDLNGNGTIDSGERWNAFDSNNGSHHNVHLPPEVTVNFELGVDWNFVSNYVMGVTTYYKSAGNQLKTASQQWRDPAAPGYVAGQGGWSFGNYRDTRGFELNLRKQFSDFFSFTMGYNLQWADQGSNSAARRDVFPDSLFVANGHYWLDHSVDPTTGIEIPVPLSAADREKYGKLANDAIRSEDNGINNRSAAAWIPWLSHYAAAGWVRYDQSIDTSQYGDDDKAFWERVNADPNYPGAAEANLIVWHNQETGERTPIDRDRRAYGSMTFLFATPAEFGPWGGQALGNLRANLVYRIFTGTRFSFAGLAKGIDSFEYGPMHTRVDLNAEKQIGVASGNTLTLAVEVMNLFNQKDLRQTSGTRGVPYNLAVDMDQIRWQTYGISGAEPVSADYKTYGEINDISNYLDQPRELNFSLRLKW
jgi:hypothetical protein